MGTRNGDREGAAGLEQFRKSAASEESGKQRVQVQVQVHAGAKISRTTAVDLFRML
jgi:hypothetical protein